MFRQKEYDLIMSIGTCCNCTEALKYLKIRKESCPFDWIFGSRLSKRIKVLQDRFENWFNFEDFEYLRIEDTKYIVRNNRTGLIYNHDFLTTNGTIKEQFESVKEKYNRRIKRLINTLDSEETTRILLVYFQRPLKNEPDGYEEYTEKELNSMITSLEEAYPKSIFNLLYVNSNDRMYPNKIKILKSPNKKLMLATTYNRYKGDNKEYLKFYKNLIKIIKKQNIRTYEKSNFEKLYLVLKTIFM